MWYHVFELNHVAVQPLRWAAEAGSQVFRSPLNPMAYTQAGRSAAAAFHVFDRFTRRYGKPDFGLTQTIVDGAPVTVEERVVWRSPWMRLIHFRRDPELLHELSDTAGREDPPVLLVAPMSGHYATLLRGTVEAMLPHHDVYITDWSDARHVSILEGRFDFHSYIDTLIAVMREAVPCAHVIAVCQPGPAALAAVALLNEAKDPRTPLSLTIMGSPIDARESPTEPNRFAMARPLSWFRDNLVTTVPWPYPGVFREVYPGFLQLQSFINMNRARHVDAHWDYFVHLVHGDGDNAAKHRAFYDEYLAVMDLTAEFYLQTLDVVFQRHLLPRGQLEHRGQRVSLPAIRKTAVLTVEGEHDDISGIGQTQAAHRLLAGLPSSMKADHVQAGVGHYGVFNGSRFRAEIQPKIAEFIRAHDRPRGAKILPFERTPSRKSA